MKITKKMIKDLRAVASVYEELYTQFDPTGAIAIHIQFECALWNVISAMEKDMIKCKKKKK